MALLLFLCTVGICHGQSYNLNKLTGLPSNNVYETVVDCYGYLWLATDKGVVKYNGYSTKIFDLSNILPFDDVFGFTYDKKNRLWLHSRTSKLGFLQNDKYSVLPYKDILHLGTVPMQVTSTNEGIRYFNDSLLYYEDNDTIYALKVDASINEIGQFYILENNKLYLGILSNHKLKKLKVGVYYNPKKASWAFGEYIIDRNYNLPSDTILAFNVVTGKRKQIFFTYKGKIDTIFHCFINSKKAFFISQNNLYVLDSLLAVTKTIYQEQLLPKGLSASIVRHATFDSKWGDCISTISNGCYMLPGKRNVFESYKKNLNGYFKLKGDRTNFDVWWNNDLHQLLLIDEMGKIAWCRKHFLNNLKSVAFYDDNKALITAKEGVFWLNIRTGAITPLEKAIVKFDGKPYAFSGLQVNCKAALGYDSNKFFISAVGFYASYIRVKDTLFVHNIDNLPYQNNIFDSVSRVVIPYSYNRIVLYQPETEKKLIIDENLLAAVGIRGVDQIIFHASSNTFFLKDRTHLFRVYKHPLRFTEIKTNYNLHDTKINIKGNSLLIAGGFGIATYEISKMDCFQTGIKQNYKRVNYKYINDIQVLEDSLILQTDNGTFYTGLPVEMKPFTGFEILIKYRDKWIKANNTDTLILQQDDMDLDIDVINPEGDGQPTLQYKLTRDWTEISVGSLNMSHLEPGKYHTLSLKAKDDSHISNTNRVFLYVQPYWNQTQWGKQAILGISILSLLTLSFSIVMITKRKINNNHLKKKRMLELELKSIHAQLNPHFIFNVLNSGLSLIKLKRHEDAYAHIATFSKVLRSYIKSSQNKYISIEDEVHNLKNYISLQQTRYPNCFICSIDIKQPELNTALIPCLLLQPIVENAIEHGLVAKARNGVLKISFEKILGGIQCTVDDNGIGRKQSNVNKLRGNIIKENSYGSKLINDLIDVLIKYEEADIQISYEDKQPPFSGTTVLITIKLGGK